jgi:hypothetical protein
MYYYKARIYSPTLGRFLQTDPIGYGDGLNMYAYVGNNPVNRSDPSGTCGSFWTTVGQNCQSYTFNNGGEGYWSNYGVQVLGDSSGYTGNLNMSQYWTSIGSIRDLLSSMQGAYGYDPLIPQNSIPPHTYVTDNKICNKSLSPQERSEALKRAAVPGHAGERMNDGYHFVRAGGVPMGWVLTTFSPNGQSVINRTTPAHLAMGTIIRDIRSDSSGTYIHTTGFGPSNGSTGEVNGIREGANIIFGKKAFNSFDAQIRVILKKTVPGC